MESILISVVIPVIVSLITAFLTGLVSHMYYRRKLKEDLIHELEKKYHNERRDAYLELLTMLRKARIIYRSSETKKAEFTEELSEVYSSFIVYGSSDVIRAMNGVFKEVKKTKHDEDKLFKVYSSLIYAIRKDIYPEDQIEIDDLKPYLRKLVKYIIEFDRKGKSEDEIPYTDEEDDDEEIYGEEEEIFGTEEEEE